MKNGQFNTSDVKSRCEKKLNIEFRPGKEYNGWFELDGKKACRITVPKGKKPIPPKTYKSMATQLKLQVGEFDEFMECPLTLERYLEILRTRVR